MENILELEKSLFKYDYMSNKEYLNNIIADNYKELGKSGILFYKDDVVNYLLSQQRDRDIEMYNFSGEELMTDLWIVHYITLSDNKKIYRTSIWKHNKIIFHQASEYKDDIDLMRS
jgi:hypothetical protein